MSGLTLAIDLGGTQVRTALVDGAGKIIKRASDSTDVRGGPRAVLAQMRRLAKEAGFDAARKAVKAVGISAPGPLDIEKGTVIAMPTLPGWQDFPLRQAVGDEFGLPAILENDGIAAVYGEWKFGAGLGFSHLVYVTISTGIGGGVVADGKLLHGRQGMAGHIGHMMIARDGPRCGCGGTGCFEALASGTALGHAARARGFADAASMVEAARAGNAVALALLDDEADILGYGFASLLYLYSPERLIIGGGVAAALDLMLARIRARIDGLAMAPFRAADIVSAALGGNAGLVGAAGLAANASFRNA